MRENRLVLLRREWRSPLHEKGGGSVYTLFFARSLTEDDKRESLVRVISRMYIALPRMFGSIDVRLRVHKACMRCIRRTEARKLNSD